ncbi:glycosyltransferase [Blastopirellula marina]|uniref:Spore protein YkvP/CgeB glycosyl transferase-like domain-containing protein n=1 Tax=Blastopirellula marina TaxID=124 RepID=A0A2S8GLW1_9BACT|nr:glycosyltransferase [Blastopirellula marina]PQO45418.1 hypothetical protein C5Y93_13275 [Blastopirellula marina]
MTDVLVVSAVTNASMPAMACVSEFEETILDTFQCDHVRLSEGESIEHGKRYKVVFVVAISFSQLVQMLRKLRKYRLGGKLVAFVFDAFLSRRYMKLPSILREWTSYHKVISSLDCLYTPMLSLVDFYKETLGVEIQFLPIGVDALKYGYGGSEGRWVDVNGYGRQPPEVTRVLSDFYNTGRNGFFYHTNHMKIQMLTDIAQHRAMFWQLLRSSRLALAYSPESFDPDKRFECSFVGQRWFESLAAGCVVVGKRPSATEVDELLDWEDSTIDLPDDAESALEEILGLSKQNDRIEAAARRNHSMVLARHDWRFRIEAMANDFCPQLQAEASAAADKAREAGDRVLNSI